ncbi:MAG: tRNA (adenosine(37)-N6)-threonylcarbamoyltransferase complex transferase subunit TsaD [Deltaproteobacteria bacterium]|nr:tRNA (adenosine(37)-N6)-threonylcarbamoyltransferase complex transferase subunit TsaD [Deltaproteobacteria bacterium]
MKILGIETSCDETAASIVENGRTVLSSVISTQIDIHHQYGGVVPELASRNHIEAIVPVVNEAFDNAGLNKNQIDGVSVTQGPGLVGALLVGFTFAKSFAYAQKLPFIGVNHLEGHISSVFLENNSPEFPYVALLVSGGHTSIYYVKSHTEYELMGQTRDDAVGEAYDKVSKMVGYGYPGGKVIDDLAKKGDKKKIKFPRSYLEKNGFDFSFSGLKTSVNRYLKLNENYMEYISDIAAGFQESVIEVLSYKILNAAKIKGCNDIAIVGGVAANSRLREKVTNDAKKYGINVYIPSIEYCGDNAAMIASIGYHYLKKGITTELNGDVYSRPKVVSGKKHK